MFRAVTKIDQWLHAPAPAERLAALRITTGAFITVYMLGNVREFDRVAALDANGFEPIGIARLLDSPLPSVVVWSLFAALLVTGTAFTLGVMVRFVGPVFALLTLGWVSYHSSWGQLLHFEHLFTIHVLILAVAPSADAWSLGRSDPAPPPSTRYGWPIRLLCLATVVTYLLSGIAKLRFSGADWFDPDTLATHIGYSATRMETIGGRLPPLARPILQQQWLIGPMAVGAIAVELGAPLALTSRRARNLWVPAALLFHLGTAATMLVFFGYRGLGFAMLPLFHLEKLPRRAITIVATLRPRTVPA